MSAATEHTAPTAHHPLSPSKFPAWEQCPCFEAGPAGEAAEHGGKLHEHLARHLHGKPDPFAGLAPEDRESLEWAAASGKSWQAVAWFLERKHPEQWAKTETLSIENRKDSVRDAITINAGPHPRATAGTESGFAASCRCPSCDY